MGLKRKHPEEIGLLIARQEQGATEFEPFGTEGPLFERSDIREALATPAEDGWFEAMVLRGLVDG
jgi:hypothetical protein